MAEHKRQPSDSNDPNKKDNNRPGGKFQYSFYWIIIAALLAFWVFSSQEGGLFGGPPTVDYSTFRAQIQSENVQKVTVRGEKITGELKQKAALKASENDTTQYSQFSTYLPSFGDEKLMDMLEANNVEVQTLPESNYNWWTILIWGIPLIFLIVIGIQFFRQMRMQGQNMFQIGQSKAKLQDAEKVNTTFEDVAGLKGAKTELQEIIGFLKNPDQFDSLGGEIPRGLLMVGPPGTGKTLLARAVAGEAKVPYFTITGSDFVEMFVGVGAARVRDMFEQAKKQAPCIIFIDEIDAVGRQRGAGLGGGNDEREQTLNQLLVEMDGFEGGQGVLVIAATNRPDVLDPALLRPGRFDRQVMVTLPDIRGREQILHVHMRKVPLASNVDANIIARGTPGFSGADLANLVNEAALFAARRNGRTIDMQDFELE